MTVPHLDCLCSVAACICYARGAAWQQRLSVPV
jgi:hypothetical protein